MKTTFTILSFFFIAVLFNEITAQTVRGNVFDKETGEPISFADVYLDGTTIGVNTDVGGFYTLSGMGAGTFKLIAKYLGYDTISFTFKAAPGDIVSHNFYLKSEGIQLTQVNVTARREIARTDVQISKISVSPKQIKALPSLGGEPDVAQYLQVIPGIVSTGDQGGQLFIRGGAPVQNKILLDGLNIYNPFHSLGLFSVFETEIIRNVDVFTAGFDAEYGGRTNAIIDIKTREGDKKKISGFGSISPFTGKILLEAPIKKFSEDGSSISILATGKKSLISHTDNLFYKYASLGDSIGLPFDFTDFYSKVSIASGSGSKFNVFGFNFKDGYNNPFVANIGWANTGFGADFLLVPATSSIIIDGVLGYTNYTTEINEANQDPRSSGIREIGGEINFNYYGDKSEVKYGFDFRAMATDFEFVNPFKIRLQQNQNTTEISTWAKYKYKTDRFIIEPSIRLMYYASQRRFSPEPRFGAKAIITEKIRFKFGGGYYTQNVISTTNDRDIVNLFNGFLTGPEEAVKDFDNSNLENKLLRAIHAVGGLEVDVTNDLTLNLESYYKAFPQILVINRNKTTSLESDYAKEIGEAYGVDFSAKVDKDKYSIWSTYSYGFVKRDDGEQIYPTVFDRRHNMNLVFSYYFDKKKNTSFGLRWNYGSGFPFTLTRGFYNNQTLGSANSDFLTSNPQDIGIIYSETRNSGRLPGYHRLDMSLSHKIEFNRSTGVELNASVTNAYDRDNIFYFDRLRYSRVNQLPIMPAMAAKFYF